LKRAIQEFPQLPIFPASTKLIRYRRMTLNRQDFAPDFELPPQPVFVFCGIGNPDSFFRDVDRWANVIAGRAVYRDHHLYSARDIRRLEDSAKKVGARAFLTTEKDARNLGDTRFSSLPIFYCEIEMRVADTSAFQSVVERALKDRRGVAV
jgi:tetraacyldisaccharide 4'-kinase